MPPAIENEDEGASLFELDLPKFPSVGWNSPERRSGRLSTLRSMLGRAEECWRLVTHADSHLPKLDSEAFGERIGWDAATALAAYIVCLRGEPRTDCYFSVILRPTRSTKEPDTAIEGSSLAGDVSLLISPDGTLSSVRLRKTSAVSTDDSGRQGWEAEFVPGKDYVERLAPEFSLRDQQATADSIDLVLLLLRAKGSDCFPSARFSGRPELPTPDNPGERSR